MTAILVEETDPFTSRPTDLGAEHVYDPNPKMKSGRRVKYALTWESKAIARDIAPWVRSISYVDNLTGAADDLQIEVSDRSKLWLGDWKPVHGDVVIPRIEFTQPWFGSKLGRLRLGRFTHDHLSYSGPPRVVQIKCISADISTGLRRRKRTKGWRGVTLKTIAGDIAKRAGLTLQFDGPAGSAYDNAWQNNKSDLEFLEETCKEVGRTLKVTEGKLVIFDEFTLDSRAVTGEIDLLGGNVINWRFDDAGSMRYGSCHVTCLNPGTGKKVKGEFPPPGRTIPGLDPNGQTLEMAMSSADNATAARRAEALLRNANKFSSSGELTVMGDPGLVAGVTFTLTNALAFNGKYIITKAEHKFGSGYNVALSIRRCLEGY